MGLENVLGGKHTMKYLGMIIVSRYFTLRWSFRNYKTMLMTLQIYHLLCVHMCACLCMNLCEARVEEDTLGYWFSPPTLR